MKQFRGLIGAMMLLPLVSLAYFEATARRYTPHTPPPNAAPVLSASALRDPQPAPTPSGPPARREKPRTVRKPVPPKEAPKAPAETEATGQPSELEAAWRSEREGGDLATLRQNDVRQFFSREDASAALRTVTCRETMCQVVFDYSVVASDDHARTTALKLGEGIQIVQNDDDHVTALVPFRNIEELRTSSL